MVTHSERAASSLAAMANRLDKSFQATSQVPKPCTRTSIELSRSHDATDCRVKKK